MTLLEMTIVILVLLALISVLFIGARAWKRSSDRAGCILNVRNAQQAIRGYANTRGLNPGDPIPGGLSRETVLTTGTDSYFRVLPPCPSGAAYIGQAETTIPAAGSLMMQCNFGDTDTNHYPKEDPNW